MIPKILYKYRCDNERTLNMLSKNWVYFANPSEFNDPFDCSAQENMHEIFRYDLAKVWASMQLEKDIQSLTREEIEIFNKCINQLPNMIDSQKDIQEQLNELGKMSVLSFSARNDSILMWSHYADLHKGFCIGYKTNVIDPNNSIL